MKIQLRVLRTLLGSAGLAALAGVFFTQSAAAQAVVGRPVPLPAHGRSVASTDDGTALLLNPANLAFMPGPELRWTGQFLSEESLLPWQGHAFTLASPLGFGLATALRLDFVDPPDALANASTPFARNYQWLTWGLALKASNAFSLGATYQHSFSLNRLVDGIDAWTLGMSLRPANHVGLSLVAHDIASPESKAGRQLAASYDAAIALRPLGSRVLELGLEGRYLTEDAGYWVPRATLGVDIPELGRLRGEFAVADPTEESRQRAWLASALMSFAFNGASGSMEFGVGSVFGQALGAGARGSVESNLNVDLAFKGYREPRGTNAPPFAVRIRVETTPDARNHVALLRKLWNIADREPSVAAVVLELRSAPGTSLAHVQELRDAVHYLRTRGKRVLCHLEDAEGGALYLCSAANRILLSPGGGIRFAGLKARYLYYKNLLDSLGVKADFVRIGAHKSAPEAFTREGSSPVAREDKIDLLQQFERLFTLGVSAGRKIEPLELRRRIATGPFIAAEAKQAGLVDELAFDDQIQASVSQLLGGPVKLLDDSRGPFAPTYFGATRGISLIYLDGDMVDGRSQVIPLLGMKMVGSYTIAETIKNARDDRSVAAVVLRVESGGGSALAADVIWREVELTAKVKPVVVSMGSAAASAAYYISAPATKIYANPLTITGSIGVFYGKADASELLRKLGVNAEVYKTAPRADAESFFRPYSAEERVELERKVGQFYEQFLSRVSAGRHLSRAEVDAVGQGKVWTGEQARARRLVDELGGLRQALAEARKLAELPEHAPIVELPVVETSLVGRLVGIDGLKESEGVAAALPPQLLGLARALAPFVMHAADKPMARIEITDIDP